MKLTTKSNKTIYEDDAATFMDTVTNAVKAGITNFQGIRVENETISRMMISSLDMTGAEFNNVKFEGCTLHKMTMMGATFRVCEFVDCWFEHCNLHSSVLKIVYIKHSVFNDVDMKNCNIDRCTTHAWELTKVNLSACSFFHVDHSGFKLKSCVGRGSTFKSCNMNGTYAHDTDMTECEFDSTLLLRANFIDVKVSNWLLKNTDISYVFKAAAHVQFDGHGESGRSLYAIIIKPGDEPVFTCGCFWGSEKELVAKYIADEKKASPLRRSREFALRTVKALLDYSLHPYAPEPEYNI